MLAPESVSADDTSVIYLASLIIFLWSSLALRQAPDCTPTPGLAEQRAPRGCELLGRGRLRDGLGWELQGRAYLAPRAGSRPLNLRLSVITQHGKAVAWTEPGYGQPGRPERLNTPRGLLLHLPVAPAPGATVTRDEVWLRREPLQDWVRLDVQQWRREAEARLGPGEQLSPGIALEIRPLRATSQILRPGDAADQPSGGGYTAWLDLGEDRLVLIGFSRR